MPNAKMPHAIDPNTDQRITRASIRAMMARAREDMRDIERLLDDGLYGSAYEMACDLSGAAGAIETMTESVDRANRAIVRENLRADREAAIIRAAQASAGE